MKSLPPGLIIALLEKKFGLKVKKHSRTYSVRCPFHDDNKASALVIPEINVFTCMVCGIKLKKRWDKLRGKETKEEYRKYYYIPAKAVAMLEGINKKSMSEEEWKEFVKEFKKGNISPSKEFYIENNKNKNNQYNPIEIWNLCKGYLCPKSIKYLNNRKITGLTLFKKDLIRFLTIESSNKNKLLKYLYKDGYRILIPLYDYSGKNLVNIQFRRIETNKDLPKAKFLPGGKVTDFGLESLEKNKIATFFVEGSTDYLSLKSLGYTNVIGLTNINSSFASKEKIFLLKNLPKIIFMFYDKDDVGINFMSTIKEQIKKFDKSKVFIPIHILSSKKNIKDINDYIIYTENPKEKINQTIINTLNKILKKNQKKQILENIEKLL